MGFDNVARKDSKDDLFPVFKSDIEGPAEPLIPIVNRSVGIRPISALTTSLDAVGQWRLFSEQLRDRRLHQEPVPQPVHRAPPSPRSEGDPLFQTHYEQDGIRLSTRAKRLSREALQLLPDFDRPHRIYREALPPPPLEDACELLPENLRYFEQHDITLAQVDTGWLKRQNEITATDHAAAEVHHAYEHEMGQE